MRFHICERMRMASDSNKSSTIKISLIFGLDIKIQIRCLPKTNNRITELNKYSDKKVETVFE